MFSKEQGLNASGSNHVLKGEKVPSPQGHDCSPRKKRIFLKNNVFSQGKAHVPNETYVSNLFAMIIISYLFLYRLANYYWKGLKENYNYVVRSIPIKTYMQKLCSHKFSNTFVPQKHGCSPREHSLSCSSWAHDWPQGEIGLDCPKEQMSLKFCMIITFAYEF
jgi:hypothetical protein